MPDSGVPGRLSDLRKVASAKLEDYRSLPQPLLVLLPSAFALGSVSTLLGGAVYRRYFRRIRNGDWIMPDAFSKRKWVKGRVTSVGDADNFRFYHTPGFGWRWPLKFRRIPSTSKDLREQTMHIRIAGVDAPEGSHFGRPAQPYAAESLAWLRERILGRTVYCQLIRRDQYSRIVAVVVSPRVFPGRLAIHRGTSLSLEMLQAGWGTVYEQAGAEYGRWGKDVFLKAEAEAKAARKGMWAGGTKGETPAEYKRRYANAAKENGSSSPSEAASDSTPSVKRWFGWLRR